MSNMTVRKPIPLKDRLALYREYCQELKQYDKDPSPWDMKQAADYAESCIRGRGYEWLDIYQDNILCGFLILGYDLPVHGNGLYICEAYVKPDFRERGLMSDLVRNKLRSRKGKIYLTIYDKNLYAQEFWGTLLRDCRAGMLCQNVVNETSGLTEYTFEI